MSWPLSPGQEPVQGLVDAGLLVLALLVHRSASAVWAAASLAAADDEAVNLRQAHEHHWPEISFAALRYARANDPTFPVPAGKRSAELLYQVVDLKRWARNRPRTAVGTTDLS